MHSHLDRSPTAKDSASAKYPAPANRNHRQPTTLRFVGLLVLVAMVPVLGEDTRGQDKASPQTFSLQRIQQLESTGEHQTAYDALSKRLLESPDESVLYYWRGRQAFCLGRIEDAVQDFDRYFEEVPASRPRQWERGIALYYAGRFADGAKQFDWYQDHDKNDVENSIWHYLCVARKDGVQQAQESILPVKDDTRIPMMEIFRLFSGTSTPEKVLEQAQAATAPNADVSPPLFYAHLYIGLYQEVHGNVEDAKRHLKLARAQKIQHYMWNVADVHVRRWDEQDRR